MPRCSSPWNRGFAVLHQLDIALENMIRRRLGYDRGSLDIAFETPDTDFRSTVTKPTLNLFLWDIRRSADEAHAGRERVIVDRQEVWRQRPPRIDFQYLLTAWTDHVADEHELLGRSLVAMLGCQSLDGEDLPSFADATDQPPSVRVARADGKDLADFWGAIDGKLKPGLNLVISATVDPEVHTLAGPPTEEYNVVTGDLHDPALRGGRHRVAGRSDAIGAVVRSPRGTTVVDADGHFLVEADPGDEIVIESPQPAVMRVPDHGAVMS